MTAVRAGTQGLLAAREQPLTLANGTASGGHRIGGQTVSMARGVPMAGRGSRLTGSTFPVAQSLITLSQIGEAQRAGGVILSWLGVTTWFRRTAQPVYQAGALAEVPLLGMLFHVREFGFDLLHRGPAGTDRRCDRGVDGGDWSPPMPNWISSYAQHVGRRS
jgi:hypothetical protein